MGNEEFLGEKYRSKLGQQDYSSRPTIQGVELKDLRRFTDDGGDFQELARFDETGAHLGFPGFKVRQVNFSTMEPGAVKAFHLHFNQDDLWFIPPQSKLLVGLVDCRKDSKTADASMRIAMGDGKSQVLFIPRGVAHGAANIYSQKSTIVYLVNQHFSPQPTDEKRLPWDLLGKHFWAIIPG